MLLAGDVGGTKVRIALFEANKKLTCKQEKKYKSRDYEDLISLMRDFLESIPEESKEIKALCVGVAGPVVDGRCQETNMPWIIDARELKAALKIPKVWVINDLEANAWGLKILEKHELVCLSKGENSQGNQALISAGTGLGEAGLYWDGTVHHPFGCEGGHADFAPVDDEQVRLWHFLRKQFKHVSYERILCGSGIYLLYRFLVDVEKQHPDPEVEACEDEPQKLITQKALNDASKTCLQALKLFVSIYGAESGNFALKMMSIGGVYVGGGIAPLIAPFFTEGTFMRSFTAKGRFDSFLDTVPVNIVLNERTALLGAARYAQEKE